jgi:type II secretory ATPase GspE/PulE/Tfp pilus assembly ATPase PilB-like protein
MQIQVEHQHTTFAEVLRTVLRADPDVILVGEIRDTETAAIAVQAAMTGHLVLATLHTNDALSAPLRLLDLGVDPKLLAIALRGVCAQRLLPRLAGIPELREATDIEKSWLELHGVPNKNVHIPEDNSSVFGVFPLIELMLVDDKIREILSSPSLDIQSLAAEATKQLLFQFFRVRPECQMHRKSFQALRLVMPSCVVRQQWFRRGKSVSR